MKFSTKILTTSGIIAGAIVLLIQPSYSKDLKSYYKGKTVRFIVGFGAGGGYDTYSRMLAPHLEKQLGASVVVENLPGAGGMKALNRMYLAPADGLQLTIVNGTGAGLQQLLGISGVRFDLNKFGYLGIIDYSRWIWLVTPGSPIKTPQDALNRKTPLNWGGSGKISGTTDGAAFTCFTLKLNCKIVSGYKGSAATALAVAKGEMDALYVSETSAYNYVTAKSAQAVATMNRKRSILFPDLPTIFESMKLSKEQQWWIDYRATLDNLGRILVVPPNTPKEILAGLQDVTRKILTDPKVVAEANKKKRYIKFVPAEEAKKMVLHVLNGVTPEQKARIKEVVLGN